MAHSTDEKMHRRKLQRACAEVATDVVNKVASKSAADWARIDSKGAKKSYTAALFKKFAPLLKEAYDAGYTAGHHEGVEWGQDKW